MKLVALFNILAIAFGLIDQELFINTNIEVHSRLGTHDNRQTVYVNAEAQKPTNNYYVAVPLDVASNLAYLKASLRSSSNDLKVTKGEIVDDTLYYNVVLTEKLVKGKSIDLILTFVWAKVSKPFPAVLAQNDHQNQLYLHTGNAYFYSPFKTTSSRHLIKLPNSIEPKSYTKSITPVNKKGRGEIEYGPFAQVPPFKFEEFNVHFANPNAALIAKNYEKSIKVAYLRPLLHFQEDYEVHHNGAKLKGHFSQVDHKMGKFRHGTSGGVTSFDSIIPKEATEIYFKDLIGNVSTSSIVHSKKQKIVELKPRYPLYGGWRYSWFHGYTVPQSEFLKSLGGSDYEISIPMTPTVKGLLCEKAKLTVILPEGARQIRIENPYDGVQSVDISYLYFDTIGRPTVIIERDNLVDEMEKAIKIKYTYPTLFVFLKPAAILTALFGVFGVIYMFSATDFSIVLDPKVVLQGKVKAVRQAVREFESKEHQMLVKLNALFEVFKVEVNVEVFEKQQKPVFEFVESTHKSIKEFSQRKDLGEVYPEQLKQLLALLEERFSVTKKMHAHALKNLKAAKDNQELEKKFNAAITDFESKLKDVDSKIKQLL